MIGYIADSTHDHYGHPCSISSYDLTTKTSLHVTISLIHIMMTIIMMMVVFYSYAC